MADSLALRQDEYVRYDALGLAELVARKELRVTELLDVAISRAQAVQPRINAIVCELYDQARQQARLLDARMAKHLDPRPVLAGVPFLIKDLFQDIAGAPTSAGSRAMDKVPVNDSSDTVKRWMDAGLIVFGKTNTPEFGSKNITEPTLWGPTRNPWDLTRTPGGSSGGSAAAIAAGIVPTAGASDGGGSIRIPAAACGLFGLKAARGRISSGPSMAEGLQGAAVQGVLSRSVRDSALMLDILQGPEAHAPYYMPPPPSSYLDGLAQAPGRLKIGFSTDSPIGTPVHEQAVAAVQDAAQLLTSLGHHVEPVPAPMDGLTLARDFLNAWYCHMAAMGEQLKHKFGAKRSDFEFDTRSMMAVGKSISAPEYLNSASRWNEHTQTLAKFHARYDLWLSPALAAPPPKIGELTTPTWAMVMGEISLGCGLAAIMRRTSLFNDMILRTLQWTPHTQLANLTGRPAMSVPLYWTPEGLPLGVQFVAGLNGEMTLLRLAAQLEQARPWFNRLPAI